MRRAEIVWEAALAFIAFAGAFTLLGNFFPSIPGYIFGALFLVAFIFICASLGWRLYESAHPAKVATLYALLLCTEMPYNLKITMGFTSHETVIINKSMMLEWEKHLFKKLSEIATIQQTQGFVLDTNDNDKVIKVDRGGYVQGEATIPLLVKVRRNAEKLGGINYKGRIKVGWYIIGTGAITWNRIGTVGIG